MRSNALEKFLELHEKIPTGFLDALLTRNIEEIKCLPSASNDLINKLIAHFDELLLSIPLVEVSNNNKVTYSKLSNTLKFAIESHAVELNALPTTSDNANNSTKKKKKTSFSRTIFNQLQLDENKTKYREALHNGNLESIAILFKGASEVLFDDFIKTYATIIEALAIEYKPKLLAVEFYNKFRDDIHKLEIIKEDCLLSRSKNNKFSESEDTPKLSKSEKKNNSFIETLQAIEQLYQEEIQKLFTNYPLILNTKMEEELVQRLDQLSDNYAKKIEDFKKANESPEMERHTSTKDVLAVVVDVDKAKEDIKKYKKQFSKGLSFMQNLTKKKPKDEKIAVNPYFKNKAT